MNKNKLIHRPAHFVLCAKCKKHGHIMYSEGNQSIELCSIESAEAEIQSAIDSKFLLAIEVPELKNQIENSGLPLKVTLVAVLSSAVEIIRGMPMEPVERPSHMPPPCMN